MSRPGRQFAFPVSTAVPMARVTDSYTLRSMAVADATMGIWAVFVVPAPPPQAAQSLVRSLWRRGGGRPNVSAVFVSHSGQPTIEFVNVGSGPASVVRYFLMGDDAATDQGAVGNLQPGESQTVQIGIAVTGDAIECAWTCRDAAGRLHVWSYDGPHKRLKKGSLASDVDCFRMMYPDRPSH